MNRDEPFSDAPRAELDRTGRSGVLSPVGEQSAGPALTSKRYLSRARVQRACLEFNASAALEPLIALEATWRPRRLGGYELCVHERTADAAAARATDPTRADLTCLQDPLRLAVLRATGLLDAPPISRLTQLTALATWMLDAPAAVITLVDASRQFFAAEHGLDRETAARRETPLSHSFCKHVVCSGAPLVVDDARGEPLVCDNPAVDELGVMAYAGFPLVVDAQVLGALGAIDSAPRTWAPRELWALEKLAAVAADELSSRTRRAA